MITTTTAPPWLRRSDQAITWARTMLQPHQAVVIDCETTDLPGALTGKVGYSNLRNTRRRKGAADETHCSTLSVNLFATVGSVRVGSV